MKDLVTAAQEVVTHALNGPAENGQVVRNSLSTHFERFVFEIMRKVLIDTTQQAQRQIDVELQSLRALMPPLIQGHIDFTAARVNAILQSLYKERTPTP